MIKCTKTGMMKGIQGMLRDNSDFMATKLWSGHIADTAADRNAIFLDENTVEVPAACCRNSHSIPRSFRTFRSLPHAVCDPIQSSYDHATKIRLRGIPFVLFGLYGRISTCVKFVFKPPFGDVVTMESLEELVRSSVQPLG